MSEAKSTLNPNLNPINASFNSTELEHSYRQYYLDQDKLQVIIAIVLISVTVIIFSYSDYQFFGYTSQFYRLIAVRAVILLFSAIIIFALWKLKSETIYDTLMFAWAVAFCIGTLYISSTRPPTYNFHLLVDVPILFSLYAIFPNRLKLQAILAVYETLGLFWIYFHYKNLSPVATRAIWVSLVIVNIFGFLVSRRLHLDRRTQYNLLLNEKRLTGELKDALENIKTLKGLLPICASCKKIRDDSGYWHQVEVYIHEHTDVNFSHGICPDCVEKLYPNLGKNKQKN